MKSIPRNPKTPPINNFVAKHAATFNKGSVVPNKLKTYVRKEKHPKKLGM